VCVCVCVCVCLCVCVQEITLLNSHNLCENFACEYIVEVGEFMEINLNNYAYSQ